MSYKSKNGKLVKKKVFKAPLGQLESDFDIHVEGWRYPCGAKVVLVCANAKGRKVVEDLWPDVEWEPDGLGRPHWLTRIRVTKLPAYLELAYEHAGIVSLADASPNLLGFAVALSLQSLAEPRRVCLCTGHTGHSPDSPEIFDVTGEDRKYARDLSAEYVPASTIIGMPESVN